MRIDFSQPVTVRDVPVQFEKDKSATLGDACRIALNVPPKNKQLGLEETLKRGRLALRISEGGEIEVTPENVAMIRQSLADAFVHPELVVVIYDMLDPGQPSA
jgi:hypothetical protein